MTRQPPASLSHLARSNPARVDDALGRTTNAQAALSRILASQPAAAPHLTRRRGRRLVVVALATMLLAVGAALAATDPFGFWRSANPGEARFAVDPTRHVHTPTAQAVECQPADAGNFRCGPQLHGRRYGFIDQISGEALNFDRATLQKVVAQLLAQKQISPRTAKRIEADLAAVQDSFFADLRKVTRFGGINTSLSPEGGKRLVPPRGVPLLLVCEPDRAVLSCRDLNGDVHAAVGSGIYKAVRSDDWTPAPAPKPGSDPSSQLVEAALGHPFSPAENRVLYDIVTLGATSDSGSSASSASSAP
jgi:hypothetical protein